MLELMPIMNTDTVISCLLEIQIIHVVEQINGWMLEVVVMCSVQLDHIVLPQHKRFHAVVGIGFTLVFT